MDAGYDRELRAWARRLGRLSATAGPDAVLFHVAAHVFGATGPRLPAAARALLDRLGAHPDPALAAASTPPFAPRPELLPAAYAAVLPGGRRRRHGHVQTPWWVAGRIVAVTLGGDAPAGTVVDPAVGGGAFLVAAVRHLVAAGVPPAEALTRVSGTDIDPLAVAVAEAALALLAVEAGTRAGPRLAVADALVDDHPLLAPGSAAAVVGNPPFLSPLAHQRSADVAARLRCRYGEAACAFADAANLFLLRALSLVRPGGRVGMILPESFLAARDARPARTAVARSARLLWLWRSVDGVFATSSARVVAVVLERDDGRGGPTSRVDRAAGRAFAPMGQMSVRRDALARAATWSPLLADPRIPGVTPRTGGTLADHCAATAGFRDEYYGLVPLVTEDQGGESPLLVTCGLIDPARCWWGERPARFAGRDWLRPRVELDRLAPESSLRARLSRLRVPKVLLATQTRVLEAVADAAGRFLPATPVVCVLPAPGRLWHVGAALASPVLSALAARHHSGTGLSPDAIRVPARAVTDLPAPVDAAAWDAGAALFRAACEACDDDARRAALVACATAMGEAYGIGGPQQRVLLDWWEERLPSRAGAGRTVGQSVPGPKRGARFSR